MLPRPPGEVAIEVTRGSYNIGTGTIHAKALRGPKNRENGSPRQALFLHGEEMGGNHTLLERPARWLIARDLFDLVILPDRRGSGGSSPVTHPMTLAEQAEDMRRLLDRMQIQAPLAVIGVSYGGPVALALAAADTRVECAALVAASPVHERAGGLARFFQRTGLLRRWMDWQLRRTLGTRPPQEINFDSGYDARTPREMSKLLADALKYIPTERAESLRLDFETAFDPISASIPGDLRINIPVLQVIGEGDEVWGAEVPAEVLARLPGFQRKVVSGAAIHKDLYMKAEAYYNTLFELLHEACPTVRAQASGQ